MMLLSSDSRIMEQGKTDVVACLSASGLPHRNLKASLDDIARRENKSPWLGPLFWTEHCMMDIYETDHSEG